MRTYRKSLFFIALLAALGVFASCAEEREPINRVQPNAMPKKFFVGENLLSTDDDPEFWTQATLIDVGYGGSQDGLFTSTYAQPMGRIKFTIQEDYLIARLTYERIEGSDHKGMGPKSNDGIIVAVFKISSHFDIKREYSSTTGEEYNVIGENTSDRPWFEREYMRVDFSKNLSTDNYDFDTLSMLGIYGGIQYESLAYEVRDPTDPDYAHFDLENGYFDVTNKAFAKPQMIDLSYLGWGIDKFPACWLEPDFLHGSGPQAMCNPVELTIRHSFRRVDDGDYEPANWDGRRFAAFGAFTIERKGYDRHYGMTDDKWYRFINRYNIWERSHAYSDLANMTGEIACFTSASTPMGGDVHRDEDGNGTEDECEAVKTELGYQSGARCDEFNQKCTLPYRDRKEKPQVWYYTTGSDPNYFDGTAWAAQMWDVALRSAVTTARYVECVRTSASEAASSTCAQAYPILKDGQQDENDDAMWLATEIDACRHGKAYKNEASCEALADRLGEEHSFSTGVIELAKMREMIVVCHSPVEADDPELCAPADARLPVGMSSADCFHARRNLDRDTLEICGQALQARIGDLRYNQMNVIEPPQTYSPWGIMVDSIDPYMGQTVATSVNMWSYATDTIAQSVIDQARFIKGELTADQITNGENIKDWVQAARAATGGSALPQLTEAQVANRVAEYANHNPLTDGDGQMSPALERFNRKFFKQAKNIKADARKMSMSEQKGVYSARMARAAGTALEAKVTTPMMRQLAGANSLLDTASATLLASPFQKANPSLIRDMKRRRELALGERGACMLEPAAPAPIGLANMADALERKFALKYGVFNPDDPKDKQLERANAMRDWLAQYMHRSSMVHEMGHSVGLRHNFVSSSDPYNYRPQYWALRSNKGTATRTCTQTALQSESAAAGCVGPRYIDPLTENEKDNLIWMWMHSSTMDYAGELSQDLLGLGAWDFASARMFYGESVAVYGDPSFKFETPRGRGVIDKMDNFGGILGLTYTYDGDDIHYSQLQNMFELNKSCDVMSESEVKARRPATWNDDKYGPWDPLLDGQFVKVDGNYVRCKQQPVDYVAWKDLKSPKELSPSTSEDSEYYYYYGGPAVDPQNRLRVPYGFATDHWADLGNASVYRHDNGADIYELFDFFISSQEMDHIFTAYRRNRHTFSIRGAVNRVLGRYNEKMRDAAKGLGLLKNIYSEMFSESGLSAEAGWSYYAANYFKDNILASTLAFDHYTRQLQRPQSGVHYSEKLGGTTPFNGSTTIYRSNDDARGGPWTAEYNEYGYESNRVTVPDGAFGSDRYRNAQFGGHLLENRLCDDCGDYDSEYTMNAGSYYEKLYTAYLMTESVDNFISDSRVDFLDGRQRAVSMTDVFPDGFRRWLGNNLTGDDFIKAPRIRLDGDGLPLTDTVGSNKYIQSIGWTRWTPKSGPQVCFPSESTHGIPSSGTMSSDDAVRCLGAEDAVENAETLGLLDPQVGWEQQKFLILFTLLYVQDNEQRGWLNNMAIWELGADADPDIKERIVLHAPTGAVYVAKTFGKETIFGRQVEKGIGARILEYATELMEAAYETEPVLYEGVQVGLKPVYVDGVPVVKYDPFITNMYGQPPRANCDSNSNAACLCEDNRACLKLSKYLSVPDFMREALDVFGFGYILGMRGIY
ncbi:MAG: hypothetical protein LBM75_07340 [Myxococcales bacterium]|jgi:hypothetical protein|nr:hypothetical protein [Myxococcales bacterium]